jgi:hypothetical protein
MSEVTQREGGHSMPDYTDSVAEGDTAALVPGIEKLLGQCPPLRLATEIVATLHQSQLARLEVCLTVSSVNAASAQTNGENTDNYAGHSLSGLWTFLDKYLGGSRLDFGQLRLSLKGAMIRRADVVRGIMLPRETELLDDLLSGDRSEV